MISRHFERRWRPMRRLTPGGLVAHQLGQGESAEGPCRAYKQDWSWVSACCSKLCSRRTACLPLHRNGELDIGRTRPDVALASQISSKPCRLLTPPSSPDFKFFLLHLTNNCDLPAYSLLPELLPASYRASSPTASRSSIAPPISMKASFTLVAVGGALVAAQSLSSLPQCGVS